MNMDSWFDIYESIHDIDLRGIAFAVLYFKVGISAYLLHPNFRKFLLW